MYLNTHLCNEYEIPDSKNLKFLNASNTSHGSNKIENLFLWICYSCVFKCLYEVRRQMVIELHEAYIHTGIKYIKIEFKFNKKSKDFFPLHSGKTQCTISSQTIWEQNFSLHWTCRLVQICKQ